MVHDELPGAIECGCRVYVLVCRDPFVKSLVTGQFVNGLLREFEFLHLSSMVYLPFGILGGCETVRQAMH
jgi:hypothetical protein